MATVTEKDIREMADEWGRLVSEIAPKVIEADKIKKKIFAWLKKTGRVITVTGDVAIAKRFEKFGDREIDLVAFLKATDDLDEADRNACLKVAIKEAEALIGKESVDKISNRPTVKSNALELKA